MAQSEDTRKSPAPDYRWVRTSFPELIFKFGSEWQIGFIDAVDSSLLWLIGSSAVWAIEQWEIGPKIIRDEDGLKRCAVANCRAFTPVYRDLCPSHEGLRDQFAMAALTGILASPYASSQQGASDAKDAGFVRSQDFFSVAAYVMADAMMEARKPKPSGDKVGATDGR